MEKETRLNGTYFLIIVFFLFTCSQGMALPTVSCVKLVHEGSITQSQRSALQKNANSKTLKILTSSPAANGGRRQVLVLYGESHVKGKTAHENDIEVIKQFEHRALEGEDGTPKTLMKVINFFNELSFESIRLLTFGLGPYGSAIDYAKKVEPVNRNEIKIIPLEEGPKTFEEKLASIHINALAGCLGGAMCLGIFATNNTENFDTSYQLLKIAALDVAFLFGSMELADRFSKFKDEKWYKLLFHLKVGIMNNRNDLMVKNILNNIEKSNNEPILLIMGSKHVEPIAKALQEEHGFQEVEQ